MSKIYIYYSADKNLYTQLLVSLISLVETNKQHELHILNLDMELKEYGPYPNKLSFQQIKTCENILKQYNKNNTFTEIDASDLIRKYLLKGPNVNNKHYKYGVFLSIRWLIHLIPNISSKIIWLDCDTIILGDISKLWNINIEKNELIGCRDCLFIQRWMPRWSINIQTGVMLLNIDLMLKNNTFDKTLSMIQTKKMRMTDMTSINRCCKKKQAVNKKFNDYKIHDNTIIFHGCSCIKDKNKKGYFIKTDNENAFTSKYPNLKIFYDLRKKWLNQSK